MNQKEPQIHGSMFFLFKKFVESAYSSGGWLQIKKDSGTLQAEYGMHENYPLSEMYSLIRSAANFTELSENDLKEKFGEYLVPDLLNMYKSHLNSTWKTFEVLANTELVMHKAVRKQENKANPPVLNVSRVHDKLLIIDYYSKRKMAGLAVGIIRGIAKFYNESDKINIVPNTNQDDERVQIRVEFK